MKEKIITAVSVILLFFPFTIFPIRKNPWALEQPMAEIIILIYIAVMLLGGVFTIAAYTRGKVKNNLMNMSYRAWHLHGGWCGNAGNDGSYKIFMNRRQMLYKEKDFG